MNIKTVTPAVVTLPLDRYPAIEFSVTTAGVTLPQRCLMCEVELKSARARTCSDTCRKRASRRNEAIKREVQAIQDALKNLRRFADRWPDLHTDVQKAVQESVTAASVTLMDLPYE